MNGQQLGFAALLIAACGLVADSGTAEARHCRCGRGGYRHGGGYTYSSYNTTNWSAQPTTVAPAATAPQTSPQPAVAPTPPAAPTTAPVPAGT